MFIEYLHDRGVLLFATWHLHVFDRALDYFSQKLICKVFLLSVCTLNKTFRCCVVHYHSIRLIIICRHIVSDYINENIFTLLILEQFYILFRVVASLRIIGSDQANFGE